MDIACSVHKNSNAEFMKYDHAANVRKHSIACSYEDEDSLQVINRKMKQTSNVKN